MRAALSTYLWSRWELGSALVLFSLFKRFSPNKSIPCFTRSLAKLVSSTLFSCYLLSLSGNSFELLFLFSRQASLCLPHSRDMEAQRPAAKENETQVELSVIKCWKLACVILGLDVMLQATLINAFLSGNESIKKCWIWWIPSTLSALFSFVTLFALLYLLRRLYSTGIQKLLFTTLVFTLVSSLVIGVFPLAAC